MSVHFRSTTFRVFIGICSFLLLMVWVSMAFEVTNDDCSYEVNTDKNIIKILCDRNVTFKIFDKYGGISVSQNHQNSLWFENMHIGQYRLNKSRPFSSKPYNRVGAKLKSSRSILRRTRKTLKKRLQELGNNTKILQEAGIKLNQDLEAINMYPSDSRMAHERTTAALNNQYNLLNAVMLAQNTVIRDLISNMRSLISAAQKTVRSSMMLNDQIQEEIILMNTALLQANISRVEKDKDFCPRTIGAIEPQKEVFVVGIAQGAFMKDPIPAGQIWVMFGYSDINEVVEFDSMHALNFDVSTRHPLPFFCEGTGHVVYKNALYCQKMMTNKIVKYHLLEDRWVGELTLEGAGFHDTFSYKSGSFSDVEFAVDEKGLWVIYATEKSHGDIVISKLDHLKFAILETWVTPIQKTSIGSSFMVCGVLYTIADFDVVPSYINNIYDTNTGGHRVLPQGNFPFRNAINSDVARMYALKYNPYERRLYAWNNARVEIYDVRTKS